jgi:hypothetical protein
MEYALKVKFVSAANAEGGFLPVRFRGINAETGHPLIAKEAMARRID